MSNNYDDIINMSHHVSTKYPPMSIKDRAAQFAPFSALVGYDDTIKETGRRTTEKIDLDECELESINRELQIAYENIERLPKANITFFVADKHKSGGEYRHIEDRVIKIDDFLRTVSFLGGSMVPIDDIYAFTVEKEDNYE